jgi:hypothetical protein
VPAGTRRHRRRNRRAPLIGVRVSERADAGAQQAVLGNQRVAEVVYGGIHKMSTLVQWGEVQLLDLESNRLLLRRFVTFRGDTNTAFRRAAEFVGETLKDAMPKP